jgi:hypothetical protein
MASSLEQTGNHEGLPPTAEQIKIVSKELALIMHDAEMLFHLTTWDNLTDILTAQLHDDMTGMRDRLAGVVRRMDEVIGHTQNTLPSSSEGI